MGQPVAQFTWMMNSPLRKCLVMCYSLRLGGIKEIALRMTVGVSSRYAVCRYTAGASGYALRSLEAATDAASRQLVLSNRPSEARGVGNGGNFQSDVQVERVTVLGLASKPTAVEVANGALHLVWELRRV